MTPPSAAAITTRTRPAGESLLHRIARRSADDWRCAAQVAWLLCRVAVHLRRRDFVSVLDSFALRDAAPPATAAHIIRAQQLVRWAHRAVPVQPNCLLDSLTAAAWLRQRGFAAPLSIGVKLAAGAFEAHAWLGECQHSAANFRLLYRVPATEPPR